MLDIDAAINLIEEFDRTDFRNPQTQQRLRRRDASDAAPRLGRTRSPAIPVSAFGGVLICNREVDATTAEEINKLFFEVILAPGLQRRSARSPGMQKEPDHPAAEGYDALSTKQFRSLLNGVAVQDRDLKVGGVDGELRYA